MRPTLHRSLTRRPCLPLLLGTLALYPLLSGFVLLHSQEATLPLTPAQATMTFVWDGKNPTLNDKDKFAGGQYASLADADFMLALIKESMNIWSTVPGSFAKLAVKQGDAVMDANDQIYSIVVEKNANVTTAAYAFPQLDPNNDKIINDCDINISDTAVTASDLAYTLAHELGHCLGLGHAHTNYNAMMGYSRTARTLSLGADDRAGVIYLYPDPAVWNGKSKEIVCGVAGGGAATTAGLLALLLVPVALAARRPARAKSPARGGAAQKSG